MTSIKSQPRTSSTRSTATETQKARSTPNPASSTSTSSTASTSSTYAASAQKPTVDARAQADARIAAAASTSVRPASTATPGVNPALAQKLAENPQLKTNQDLINQLYKENNNSWTGAHAAGKELGVDLNQLVKDRQGLLPRVDPATVPAPTTPPAATNPPTTTNPPAATNPPANAAPPANTPPSTSTDPMQRSRDVYVNQFDAEKTVGGDGANANCGPAALDMALGMQGLEPPTIPGLPDDGSAGAHVQRARYAMNKDYANLDGVTRDSQGNVTGYAEGENSKYTSVNAIIRGAEASGATAERITASTSSIDTALAEGKSVVVLGNFVDQATGKEKTDLTQNGWARGGGATAHFVTVTGKTADGNYIINDPASPTRGPITVTEAQLKSFMANAQTGEHNGKPVVVGGVAVAIGNPNGAPATTPAAPATNGTPTPVTQSGTLPTSAAAAAPSFLSQVTNTPGQPTSGNNNCGPTSLAMVMNQQGTMPPGLSPQEQIQYTRMLMTSPPDRLTTVNINGKDYVTSTWVGNSTGKDLNGDGKPDVRLLNDPSVPLGDSTMTGIAQRLAGPTARWSNGFDALDAALAAGHPVVADGRLGPTYGAGFPEGNKPRWNSGAHFISITGRTDDGKYIVMDPSTQRPQEMTREQLAAFFSPYGNQPHFIPAG